MDMQWVVVWWLIVSHCSLLFIHCVATMFYTDTETVLGGITELLKQNHFILFKVKVNHINWSWCCCHISDIECHIHMFCLGKIGQEWVSVGDEVVWARFNSSFGLSGWKEYCILFSILSSSEMQKSCLLKNRSDWRFDKVEINWIFSPKFINYSFFLISSLLMK